jgi:probable rRNA maturation factor
MNDGRPRLGGRTKVGGEGDVEVFAANEQGDVEIDLSRWRALATDVLSDLGVRGAAELSLLFVNVDEMTALNEEYMGGTGPTDVLAFPIDATDVEAVAGPGGASRGPSRTEPDPADLPLLLGDVVVCPAVAAAEAPDHAGSVDDELALLVVHGILHVMGHDHAEEAETATMRAEERRLLSAHHWRGAAPAGFRQDQPS